MESLGMDWSAIQTVIWTLVKILALVVPLMLGVAYLTYAERKIIGWMQVRIGPNRVGFQGLLQPIADAVKLLMKEKSSFRRAPAAGCSSWGPSLPSPRRWRRGR